MFATLSFTFAVRASLVVVLTCAAAVAQQPRIDSVSPSKGPIGGGTVVMLRGANLADATVRIDRTLLEPQSRSDDQILIAMPRHENGYALISATTSGGIAYGEYLYLPPRLDELPPGYITTVVGVGAFKGDGREATRAVLGMPVDLFVGPEGIYVVDEGLSDVRRIRAHDGVIETVVGSGVFGVRGDGGPSIDAELKVAMGGARDDAGNLYVVDLSHRVRKVGATTGIISTLAGQPERNGFAGDGGPAGSALLDSPIAIVIDRQRNIIYIQEQGNARIRRIAADGTISTYAGTGAKGYSGDGGPATAAQLDCGGVDNGGLALDSVGNLYINDSGNGVIRKVDRATGLITTIKGPWIAGSIAVAENGDLFVASETDPDPRRPRIVRTDATGNVIERWGSGMGFAPDGVSARLAPLGYIRAVGLDAAGNLMFTDLSAQRVRRINRTTGLLETVAGSGPELIEEEGSALATTLSNFLGDLAILADGSLLISEPYASRFRRKDRNGQMHTVAYLLRDQGELATPFGFDLRPDGTVVFAEVLSVKLLDPSGKTSSVAGDDHRLGHSGDGGPARDAAFAGVMDVAVDTAGNIFVADAWNNRIRRIDGATMVVSTIAGKGPPGILDGWGTGSYCGDGGPATEACLNSPSGLAIAADGTLFVGDAFNSRIRKIDPAGLITTFRELTASQILIGPGGNLFICSGRKVERLASDGTETIIAGDHGVPLGFAGDGGPATAARLRAHGGGIAIDGEGNLFFADTNNLRIRAVRYGAVLAPPDAKIEASATDRAITVTVVDGAGKRVAGVRVDFITPSVGASCTLAPGFAITNANGTATVRCPPNCIAGVYTVTARPLGSTATAEVSLQNKASPCRRRAVRR